MKPSPNPEPFAVDAVLEQVEWDVATEEDKKRSRKILARINAQRPRPKVIYRRARLWQLAILCFIGSLVVALYALFPLMWRIFR